MVKAKTIEQYRKRIDAAENGFKFAVEMNLIQSWCDAAAAASAVLTNLSHRTLRKRKRRRICDSHRDVHNNSIKESNGILNGSIEEHYHDVESVLHLPKNYSCECKNDISIQYLPVASLSTDQFESVVQLFHTNMSELYRQSARGLNMNAKRAELSHRKAHYLLLLNNNNTTTSTAALKIQSLVGFVHFRFCTDDDDDNDDQKNHNFCPSCVVLYVYEIQIDARWTGQGWGRKLMQMCETIAHYLSLDKVMLTAFKNNPRALLFYKNRLGYVPDAATDPNVQGEPVDYEILMKPAKTILNTLPTP